MKITGNNRLRLSFDKDYFPKIRNEIFFHVRYFILLWSNDISYWAKKYQFTKLKKKIVIIYLALPTVHCYQLGIIFQVVYVSRNPKDMAVSYFTFFKALKVYPISATLEATVKALMAGQTVFSPYWPHVKQAWQKRHHPNLHFVFYEDMKKDIMLEMRKINEFLGTNMSEERLEAIAQYTSFSAMKSRGDPLKDDIFEKENENEVKFFRKGKMGDWKNHFTPEQTKEMDEWIKKNVADTDLSLNWALAE